MNYYEEDFRLRIKTNLIIGFILLGCALFTLWLDIKIFAKPLYLWVLVILPFAWTLLHYLNYLYNKRSEKALKKAKILANDERLRILKYREESFIYYTMGVINVLFFSGFYFYLGAEGIGNIFYHLWGLYALVLITVSKLAKNYVKNGLKTKEEKDEYNKIH
ncbi:hypothetical protein IMX26_14455 [Clostridium sp. 'deep sea']|uniref:hypothetical protein n=1 Tax=Clostridium sp. 'deep sea' TaxID=2779445 RepID=UPI0018967E7C|nr:hypothetical protein [Clostridium sp. 'deep sea']QOR34659.1 hypothetical protein IMX26_14455 [Clostridium sp. 'deep sea']